MAIMPSGNNGSGDGSKSISSSTGSLMPMPYPDFPPTYTVVRENGGYHRDCLVIDLSTLKKLDPERLAQIEDTIGVALNKFHDVEKSRIIRSDNFNVELSRALRL